MGRRKLPIEFIRNDKSRRETFKKRLKGLKGKAAQLATLCNAEVGLVVISDGSIHEASFSGAAATDFKSIIHKYAMYFCHNYQSMALHRILHPELGDEKATALHHHHHQQLPLPASGSNLFDLNNAPRGFHPHFDHQLGLATTTSGIEGFLLSQLQPPVAVDTAAQPAVSADATGDAHDSTTDSTSKSSTLYPGLCCNDGHHGHAAGTPHCRGGLEIDQLCPPLHADFGDFSGSYSGHGQLTHNFDNGYDSSTVTTATAANNSGGDGSMNSLFFNAPFPFDEDFDKHWSEEPVNPTPAVTAARNQSSAPSTTATSTTATTAE